jgi:hypothetical protein
MKKLTVVTAVVAVALSMWTVGRPTTGSAAASTTYQRAATFDAAGWHIHCSSEGCPIPIIVPWTFRLDALGTTYDAVITASFTYRTSKDLHIAAVPELSVDGTAVPIASSSRPLASAPRTRSATLTWLVEGLDGSTTYGLFVSSGFIGGPPASYDISFSNLTLTVEGTPA